MSISQSRLLELHSILKETIGVNASDTLMDALPRGDWDDVVRVHHLENLKTELKGDLQTAKAELRTEMQRLATVQTRWMAGLLGSLVIAMIVALVR